MSVDERVRYLLRAAIRAEVEGDHRVARLFRRMAAEASPPDADSATNGSRQPAAAVAD